ncbi:MAG TPA: hypothetical protein PK859_03285 [Spirochaetota bacterium]|nr:hypothetical protein [Spirochaetota bacterium]HPR47771.1 hypothetical protein [Spirochaetota bacterium]
METTGKLFMLFVAFSVSFASCSKNIREYRAGNLNSDKKLLIATTGSEFKNRLVDDIVKKYHQSCSIKVIPLNSLKDVSTMDYTAIVLVDRALAWTMFNFAIKKFTQNAEEKDKIILFMTVNDTGWKVNVNDIDTVTSASQPAGYDIAYEKLILSLDRKISGINHSTREE